MVDLDPDTGWRIAVLVGLLLLSAFFSGSETALMALNRIRLRRLADSGDADARRIARLLESPSRLLSTVLIGNNLVNVAISAIVTALVLRWVVDDEAALLVATLAATTIILLVGEITPKAIAAHAPEPLARRVHRAVEGLVWLLTPINRLFGALSDLLVSALGHKRRHEGGPLAVSEEDVRTMLMLGRQQGVFAPEEEAMVERIFAFTDLRVRDVMVPRLDVAGIPHDITWADLLALVRREHYTRYPVYKEDLDHVIGILHVKELMMETPRGEQGGFDVARFIRPAYFVPDSKRVVELLREMRQKRAHMAVVVDEYGATAGIVTIEDLVEQVVGEIADEFDQREPEVRQLDARTYSVAGTVRLEEINDRLGLALSCEEADTIAGLVLSLLGRIPEQGDRAERDGVELVVERMDGQRIERLTLKLPRTLSRGQEETGDKAAAPGGRADDRRAPQGLPQPTSDGTGG